MTDLNITHPYNCPRSAPGPAYSSINIKTIIWDVKLYNKFHELCILFYICLFCLWHKTTCLIELLAQISLMGKLQNNSVFQLRFDVPSTVVLRYKTWIDEEIWTFTTWLTLIIIIPQINPHKVTCSHMNTVFLVHPSNASSITI